MNDVWEEMSNRDHSLDAEPLSPDVAMSAVQLFDEALWRWEWFESPRGDR